MRMIGYFMVAMITALLDISYVLAEGRQETLNRMEMHSVATAEGFKYFAGIYDRSEFPTDFITVYTYRNIGDIPKITILGNTVEETFPVSEIDTALSFYRSLVLKKWKIRSK